MELILALMVCNYTEVQWHIHGNWPQSEYCHTDPFDVNRVQPILYALNKYWYSCFEDNVAFWQHEWGAHGTCSIQYPNQLAYFNATLQYYYSYQPDFKPCEDSWNSSRPLSCEINITT